MRLPPDNVCKRLADLFWRANDPANRHEADLARATLHKLCGDFGVTDFMLCWILDRQRRDPDDFDPVEIICCDLFERFGMKLAPEQEIVVALWAAHAHVYNQFTHTPRLLLRSREPGVGKSALMGLLDGIIDNSLLLHNTTPPVIHHWLRHHPRTTFLIDEGEHQGALWFKDRLLLSVLDSGHRRGGQVLVWSDASQLSLMCSVQSRWPSWWSAHSHLNW